MDQRVLIVDDHPGFRAMARVLLEAHGFRNVGEAADGRTALAAAAVSTPDLVLVDIQLPDIDGFEVARRLQELDPGPIVVLTSTRDACDYGRRLREPGIRAFIPKSKLTSADIGAMLSA